ETVEQIAHRGARQRFEGERAEAVLARAPTRPLPGELRPGEGEHEQRMPARPVEQVFEKVEQPTVRPLQILEDENRRRVLCQALEEDAPRREEVLLVTGNALLEPEQMGKPRFDPGAF